MFDLKKDSSSSFDMFGKIDSKLGMIFFDALLFLEKNNISKDIIITSIIRSKENDSGVHSLGRAIDIRNNFDREIGKKLEDYINTKYPYDESRPELKTIIFHEGVGYNGDKSYHYHLQVNNG